MRARWLLVCIATVSVSIARADDRARLEAQTAAQRLEREARDTRDPEKYVACGQAYLDLYNQDPKDPAGDEVLYNAGICFQQAKSIGLAISTFETLAREFPRSKLAPRAVARAGHQLGLIGSHARAAEALERYATTYSGERDAFDALSDAFAFRGALGDDAKQIANARELVKRFGAKRPIEVAHAMYAITETIAKRGAEAKEQHLRAFLRDHGGKVPELAVQAQLALGESLWRRSCPGVPSDGPCIVVARPRGLPIAAKRAALGSAAKRCGSTSATIKAVPRNVRIADEAIRQLQQVERLAARITPPTPATRSASARASLVLADRVTEQYLAVRFPTNLDFSPDRPQQTRASVTRFQAFLQDRQKLGATARDHYTKVLAVKDAVTSIAATQRLGFLPHAMADELLSAELPRDVRTGDYAAEKIAAFCDKLTEVAEPMIQQATTAYDVCLAKAGELGVHDATVRACASQRAALGPTTFALTSELVPELPIALPVSGEALVPRSPSFPRAFGDAVDELWSLHGRAIPAPRCKALARTFETFGRQAASADALFMAGVTHGRCNQVAKAKVAYTAALAIDPKHGKSLSNLAELDYRAGNPGAARQQWERALAGNGTLIGANLGLATLALAEARGLPASSPNRARLLETAERHATSAAALGAAATSEPYMQLAVVALLRDQLPRARYLAARARDIATSPYTELLRAALAARDVGGALPILEAAADAPAALEDTHLALALHYLQLRRPGDASTALAKIKRVDYDVLIARGLAARGAGKWAEAEAHYTRALALDATRPEASFDLGVLWKDYTGARATDPATAKAAFGKAAAAFRRVGTAEARLLADDCDRAAAAR